jgi:hypothetical protein
MLRFPQIRIHKRPHRFCQQECRAFHLSSYWCASRRKMAQRHGSSTGRTRSLSRLGKARLLRVEATVVSAENSEETQDRDSRSEIESASARIKVSAHLSRLELDSGDTFHRNGDQLVCNTPLGCIADNSDSAGNEPCKCIPVLSDMHIWPRGLPIDAVAEPIRPLSEPRLVHCPIQQGLADDNSDVDAVYRLLMPLSIVLKDHFAWHSRKTPGALLIARIQFFRRSLSSPLSTCILQFSYD